MHKSSSQLEIFVTRMRRGAFVKIRAITAQIQEFEQSMSFDSANDFQSWFDNDERRHEFPRQFLELRNQVTIILGDARAST